ncbi:hypothetical protein ABZ951_19500 [Streptomyces sp. NPDC046215]|uniref:hypothetical protein n=1 Tax=Streptomyces TaxID=1883 RepID=UPI0031CE3157
MNAHLTDLLAAVVAARVFGGDLRCLLRRATAVGVRIGLSELRRPHPPRARRRGGVR